MERHKKKKPEKANRTRSEKGKSEQQTATKEKLSETIKVKYT